MNSHIISLPIILSAIAGLMVLFMPERAKRAREWISISSLSMIFVICSIMFMRRNLRLLYDFSFLGFNLDFRLNGLSYWIILAVSVAALLIGIYSMAFMKDSPRLREYWAYYLLVVGATIGALASNDLVLFLVFWGFSGLMLYLLVGLWDGSETSAKKAFVIIGGSDVIMMFGIVIIWHLTGSLQMSAIRMELNGILPMTAYFCLMIGALAKAGAIPFHGWIPDSANVAPLPVIALLPASLDKLLGIYLLAKMSLDMFVVLPNSAASIVLLTIGSVTLVIAVMIALFQHDLKKLLTYHVVSQVGYMIMGIGTGTMLGIAGALFHMINNAIYKGSLLLCAGSVEKKAGTTELNDLGGLARSMPITAVSCFICSIAISGIPPLNGFFSKWMIYLSLISLSKTGSDLWPIWLLCAMFGSAMTLASFMKVMHAVFFGQHAGNTDVKEAEPAMWVPPLILALLCLVLGIFAFAIPMNYFIFPSVSGIDLEGVWAPSFAAVLLFIGLLAGAGMYISKGIKPRRDDIFIGAEKYTDDMRVSGVEFYRTIRNVGLVRRVYRLTEEKFFDLYEKGKEFVMGASGIVRMHHGGMLHTYISWCFLGLLIIMACLVR